jgi:SAM-dependent methyltransferase
MNTSPLLSPAEILAEVAGLGKWLQAVRISDELTVPGQWNPRLILNALLAGRPAEDWRGKKVLDIGACNGGLSIELARLGADVHAIEPNDTARRQFQFAFDVVSRREDLRIRMENKTLFTVDRTQKYDIVLFLGLVYHFRYPQLVLDYLGGFDADCFFISSQTFQSDRLAMVNRKEATPQFYGKSILAGYHPSRPLLKSMIQWAGFRHVRELVTAETGRDFEDRVHQITNSAYYLAERGVPIHYEDAKDVYM